MTVPDDKILETMAMANYGGGGLLGTGQPVLNRLPGRPWQHNLIIRIIVPHDDRRSPCVNVNPRLLLRYLSEITS
jgi:hypothetical protein